MVPLLFYFIYKVPHRKTIFFSLKSKILAKNSAILLCFVLFGWKRVRIDPFGGSKYPVFKTPPPPHPKRTLLAVRRRICHIIVQKFRFVSLSLNPPLGGTPPGGVFACFRRKHSKWNYNGPRYNLDCYRNKNYECCDK